VPNPADMTKKVKGFILLGQSNMLGMGKINGDTDGTLTHAVKTKQKYPYLLDAEGNWAVRADVRNVRVMVGKKSDMQVFNNEMLTVKGKTIGPELGIGHFVGDALEEPVLLLKSCIGNRSLGWDLLPPGSQRYTVDGVTYAGYKDHPTPQTMPYEGWKDSGKPNPWYAG
jgi:hypothetical protein